MIKQFAASAAMSSSPRRPTCIPLPLRNRDAALEEVGLVDFDIPNSERDLTASIERMGKEFVEPAGGQSDDRTNVGDIRR
jgi:hypothetical protein